MRASEQLQNSNGEVRADQHSKVKYRTGRLETVVHFVKSLPSLEEPKSKNCFLLYWIKENPIVLAQSAKKGIDFKMCSNILLFIYIVLIDIFDVNFVEID